MKIQIITVGKLKEDYLVRGCNEYIKRLQPFAKTEVVELAEARMPQNPSEKEITMALRDEGDRIMPYLQKGGFHIACCIEGKQMDSRKFSALLQKAGEMGGSSIQIIIGSSHGIHPEIKKMCHKRISLSSMTFPHQLFRLMLLEQVYRGYQIEAGTKYHK